MSIGQMLLMPIVPDVVYALIATLYSTIDIALLLCVTISHLLFLLYQLAIKVCACTMFYQMCY